MTQLAKDLVLTVVENWQRTLMTVFIGILAFPAMIACFYMAQSVGWVEPAWHGALIELREAHILHEKEGTRTLQLLMNENLYYQQRTCVNTAQTSADKNDCIKPHWKRRMDDKSIGDD